MIVFLHFIPRLPGSDVDGVDVDMPCLPRKGDIVNYDGKDYRVMSRRWYVKADGPGDGLYDDVEVVLNPIGD